MKKFSALKKENLLYLSAGGALFIYILIRAINVGITYDEAWTLQTFVPLSIKDILGCAVCDANNHLLNTLLIKLFFFIGPDTVFCARLPNVLAGLLYLVYSYRFAKFLPAFPGFVVFVLLTVNPFLLDFFGLARGYGLALGFQLASVYHLLSFVKDRRIRSANYALILSSLAVISNLSVLTYWAACLTILAFVAFFIHRENKLKFFAWQFLISACLGLIIYKTLSELIKGNNLYYGGDVGFYADTLISLTKYSHYSPTVTGYTHPVLNFFLFLCACGVCFLIWANFRKGFRAVLLENILLLLLLLTILSSLAQHYLLGTLYLIDRTALLFFPLFMLVFCFSFSLARIEVQKSVLLFTVLCFTFNFLLHANIKKTALWYFDSHTEAILQQINERGIKQNRKIAIDFAWPFQGAIYYFNDIAKYPNIIIGRATWANDKINSEAEYYIYLDNSLEKVPYKPEDQYILKMEKDTLMAFPEDGVYVFENIRETK